MEQMSLFDMEETGVKFDATKRLQVVKSQFIESQSVSWQDLFEGFDEIYAITFSSGKRTSNNIPILFSLCSRNITSSSISITNTTESPI